MAENFEENNKFFSAEGTLGRRGFIVNYFIVKLIESLLFTTPMLYIIFFRPDLAEVFMRISPNHIMPFSTVSVMWIIGIINSVLLFPSILRRVRDVVAEDDRQRIFMISSVLTVLILSGYTPVNFVFPVKLVSFMVIIFLSCLEGKITGQKPKSDIIKFNWGACLGTWIWGLFNRTPITVLMLPLMLTAGWFPFMIICGLKGNEWVYKNKQYDNSEQMHKSQSNQAVVWAVLWAVLTPFLLVGSFIAVWFALYNYANSHPDYMKKLENYSQEYTEIAVKSNFTKIELTDNEYKFYIEPQIWVKLPQRSKFSMFKLAEDYVNKQKKNNTDNLKDKKEFPFITMNKIKIYSSYNNEILGEYYLDEKEFGELYNDLKTKGGFKKYVKTLESGYKINNYPAMP